MAEIRPTSSILVVYPIIYMASLKNYPILVVVFRCLNHQLRITFAKLPTREGQRISRRLRGQPGKTIYPGRGFPWPPSN